jgi:hypothetical protein
MHVVMVDEVRAFMRQDGPSLFGIETAQQAARYDDATRASGNRARLGIRAIDDDEFPAGGWQRPGQPVRVPQRYEPPSEGGHDPDQQY